jgi:hypothetical protein
MDEPWKIDYQINRRDFWLDEYFTYFYHPWVRCLMGLLLASMIYAYAHKLLLTHSLTASVLVLLPQNLGFWLALASQLLRTWNRMPPATGVNQCSASIDVQRFCCVEPRKTYRYDWKRIVAISQTIEYTLFFTWQGGTFTIPNCAFGTLDEAHEFYQTALLYTQRAKLGQKAPVLQECEVWPPAPRPGA